MSYSFSPGVVQVCMLPHFGYLCKVAEVCREDCMEMQYLSVVGCFHSTSCIHRLGGFRISAARLPTLQNLSSNSFPKAIHNRCIKLIFSRSICISKHSGSSSVALETEKSLLSQRRKLNVVQNNPLPRPNPSCTAWILRLAVVQKTGRCCRGRSTSSCEISPPSRLTSYGTTSIPPDFWP